MRCHPVVSRDVDVRRLEVRPRRKVLHRTKKTVNIHTLNIFLMTFSFLLSSYPNFLAIV